MREAIQWMVPWAASAEREMPTDWLHEAARQAGLPEDIFTDPVQAKAKSASWRLTRRTSRYQSDGEDVDTWPDGVAWWVMADDGLLVKESWKLGLGWHVSDGKSTGWHIRWAVGEDAKKSPRMEVLEGAEQPDRLITEATQVNTDGEPCSQCHQAPCELANTAKDYLGEVPVRPTPRGEWLKPKDYTYGAQVNPDDGEGTQPREVLSGKRKHCKKKCMCDLAIMPAWFDDSCWPYRWYPMKKHMLADAYGGNAGLAAKTTWQWTGGTEYIEVNDRDDISVVLDLAASYDQDVTGLNRKRLTTSIENALMEESRNDGTGSWSRPRGDDDRRPWVRDYDTVAESPMPKGDDDGGAEMLSAYSSAGGDSVLHCGSQPWEGATEPTEDDDGPWWQCHPVKELAKRRGRFIWAMMDQYIATGGEEATGHRVAVEAIDLLSLASTYPKPYGMGEAAKELRWKSVEFEKLSDDTVRRKVREFLGWLHEQLPGDITPGPLSSEYDVVRLARWAQRNPLWAEKFSPLDPQFTKRLRELAEARPDAYRWQASKAGEDGIGNHLCDDGQLLDGIACKLHYLREDELEVTLLVKLAGKGKAKYDDFACTWASPSASVYGEPRPEIAQPHADYRMQQVLQKGYSYGLADVRKPLSKSKPHATGNPATDERGFFFILASKQPSRTEAMPGWVRWRRFWWAKDQCTVCLAS
jgi:hypothetical protein